MVKNRKALLVVIAVVAVIVVAAVIMVATRKDPGGTLLKIMSERVDLQVRNIHYTEVGDSGMKWEITADAARYQKKDNLAFFDKLAVKLILKDGQTFTMTGDRGRFNTDSRDLEIEGNVDILSESGARFSTDRLRYRNADKVVETDRPVAMETDDIRIKGVGMIFALEGKKVAILSRVEARLAGGIRGNNK
jgi:LPS export ABC transporter protein LptC